MPLTGLILSKYFWISEKKGRIKYVIWENKNNFKKVNYFKIFLYIQINPKDFIWMIYFFPYFFSNNEVFNTHINQKNNATYDFFGVFKMDPFFQLECREKNACIKTGIKTIYSLLKQDRSVFLFPSTPVYTGMVVYTGLYWMFLLSCLSPFFYTSFYTSILAFQNPCFKINKLFN